MIHSSHHTLLVISNQRRVDFEHLPGKKAITSKRGVEKLSRKAEEAFF